MNHDRYKALSPEGNPEFATVLKVMRALGLKVHATPITVDFGALIAEARLKGKKAGLRKSDIAAAVAKTRGRK